MHQCGRLHRRGVLAIGGGLAALASGLAAVPVIGRTPPLRAVSGAAFGTSWHALLPDSLPLAEFANRAETRLSALDAALSPWRRDSVVTAFNRAQAGATARGDDLLLVARQSLAIAGASGGQFDPTVGPLVARFGFGPISDGSDRPDWRQIEVAGSRIVKTTDGTTFDPCGIAKGHALDRLAALARGVGAEAGFIEFGGEIIAWGAHPDGRAWRAGVEDPRVGQTGLVATLALGDAALATSGNKVNGYDFAGQSYGHIIAPDRQGPRRSSLLSVTVLAETAIVADGWATALMAAGPELGQQLAKRNDLSALFVLNRANSAPDLVTTGTLSDGLERI
ncbi:FAD:protein FMN transferase [Pseudooceanicola sp.]|uniref:FAD:protein FMN transferase n=1 Tax=Pseudooceanicola sp. TaxID=1914328 RepID=UPI00260DBFFA|nr:FAD:protein FMN transferase [Pseudooceanicola sp.]MDF1855940.1 FAD:protein FMN transferase [Pseudooceanicola sp.]